MWRISIHCDFDSLGGPLSPCVIGLGKNVLFKSVLGHCDNFIGAIRIILPVDEKYVDNDIDQIKKVTEE